MDLLIRTCVAMAAAAYLSLGTVAEAGPSRFAWPDPDRVMGVDAHGVTWANGIPVQMRVVTLKRPRKQLVRLYWDAFLRAGFYVDRHLQLESNRATQLTGLDTRTGISYTAIIQDNPDGSSNVLVAEANLAKRRTAAELSELIPLYPGTEKTVHSDSEDGQVISYEAHASAEGVLAFYRDKMAGLGFHELSPKDQPGLFVQGGTELRVHALATGKGKVNVTAILRSHAAEVP